MSVRYAIAAWALVAGLVLAGIPHTEPAFRGDVNGDARTDVLDVQSMANALLARVRAGAFADINGDGRVDVLDFQALAAHVSDEEETPARPSRRDTGRLLAAGPCLSVGSSRYPHAIGTTAHPAVVETQYGFGALPRPPLEARPTLGRDFTHPFPIRI